MKLRWSRRAVADLDAIANYIADDNPEAARRWIEALRVRARRAAHAPGTGRQVPEYLDPNVREVIHRRYRLIFAVVGRGIVVLHVTEGHRLLPERAEL